MGVVACLSPNPNTLPLTRPQVIPLAALADPAKLRRMQNELDVNHQLLLPPDEHFVCFLGSFQDDTNVYLLMELCGGWGWGRARATIEGGGGAEVDAGGRKGAGCSM